MSGLVRIQSRELIVGVPLQYTAYDAQGHLLLREGSVIHSAEQVERLIREGLFRKPIPTQAQKEEQKRSENAPKRYAMDAIRLRVGDPVQLQTNDDSLPMRYTARFMGFLKGKSVLVSAPLIDGKYAMVREGQAFIVRVFSGKDCYAFTVSVLKSVNVPYPYLHLTYPAEVMGMTVRRHARIKVRVIAAVVPTEGDDSKPVTAIVANMSTGGALVSARSPLGKKGDKVVLKFKLLLEGIEHVYAIDAILRSITAEDGTAAAGSPEAGGFVHGLEFVDLSPRDAISLSAYIYRELAEHFADTV